MLLQIETISQAPSQQANISIYACLRTASRQKDGIICTIGRQNADVEIPLDRSVSRSHCAIRLISTNDIYETITDADISNKPGKPQTAEEFKACEMTSDGWVAVLQDLGSKFGTKALFQPEEVNHDEVKDDETAIEEDDETDDEGIMEKPNSQQSQFISSANAQMICKPIPKGEGIILPTLSILKNNNRSVTPVIIQCGYSFQIRITRIPMEFCYTQMSKKDQKQLSDLCPFIGATVSSSFNINGTTHLISNQIDHTAKAICAWLRRIPTISLSYPLALHQRLNTHDILPSLDDHRAPGHLAMNDLNLDYNHLIPHQFYNKFKVLSLQEDEVELICECAGANILRLYSKDNNDEGQVIENFWMNDDFFEKLYREQLRDNLVVIWLDSSSRKVKKGKDFLLKYMELFNQNKETRQQIGRIQIHTVNRQCIFDSITKMKRLRDINDIEIVCDVSDSNISEEIMASTSEEELPINTLVQHGEESCATYDEATRSSSLNQENDITDGTSNNTQNEKSHKSPDEWLSTKSRKVTKSNYVQYSGCDDEAIKHGKHSTDRNLADEDHSRIIDLPVSNDGWMIIAPQGKERKVYERPLIVSENENGEILRQEPAQTILCKNLMVNRNNKNPIVYLMGNSKSNEKNTNDFKRFKKNSIIAGSKMNAITKITMHSVLPSESEELIAMKLAQRELEEERHATDTIFYAGEKQQSQGSSTGIRNYFGTMQSSRSATTGATRGRKRRL